MNEFVLLNPWTHDELCDLGQLPLSEPVFFQMKALKRPLQQGPLRSRDTCG